MQYPIVKITTKDNISLFGFLAEAEKKEHILINIHGTASAFYTEEFEKFFIESLPSLGVSVLFTNNRGNHVMESWQNTGAALEKFEDSLIDLDAWIEFAFSRGHEKIILQGHSLGTEKVVYYMENGKYKDSVEAIILLGFSDSFGCHMKFLQTQTINPMIEAQKLIAEDKEEIFLTSIWKSHAGVLPQNAASYVNFFSPNSELSKTLPLRNAGELLCFRNIQVPILGLIGDRDPWTVIPIDDAAELLRKENPLAQVRIINNCNHTFDEKQNELIENVKIFLNSIIAK